MTLSFSRTGMLAAFFALNLLVQIGVVAHSAKLFAPSQLAAAPVFAALTWSAAENVLPPFVAP